MKRLVFCVTNDLNYDQRMIRICHSLHKAGHDILLIGREHRQSPRLIKQPFLQKRLFCFFKKGKAFYLEYNLRLFFYLLFLRLDLICAIDLDTILPCYYVSTIRNKKRVYDAHELFCEMKEIVSRPFIYNIWKKIERMTIPKFKLGYTVSRPIQEIFKKEYGVNYEVIMNTPFISENLSSENYSDKFIIYQGTVNHGRSFETLIPAFQWINCPLWIYGDGNFYQEALQLVKKYKLEGKVLFKGKIAPSTLKQITPQAIMGITLFENNGLSNYYSLANRFFDYIQAGIPQICVNYPSYQEINKHFEVAVLIDDLDPSSIATAVNSLLDDSFLQQKLKNNCIIARLTYNWQTEERKLIQFYNDILS